ncbi:MAG: Smr/MutS family protein [Spirochaetaceae bacterium]|jgi:DNA-nicking Smr family endonuclease|nr:Smr/MutS family protein [Spirochaetaceae bacterium]
MDFGDILDEWDRKTAQAQGKYGKTETKKEQTVKDPAPEPRPHPLTAWLRMHEVYDKDAEDTAENQRPGEYRRRLLRKRADAAIDLHGLTQQEAWTALENFFQEARRQGFEKLHIIHGKGNHSSGEAVLKQIVKQFVERCPFAGESGHGNAASGGAGATWVLLKRTR